LVVAADPDAAGAFLAASRIAFAWSNSNPVYADTATRFLNALRIECGAEAYVE
jgi:ABC-type nitrate/sulfonate/bicarbonate transport system substrate-binding protein